METTPSEDETMAATKSGSRAAASNTRAKPNAERSRLGATMGKKASQSPRDRSARAPALPSGLLEAPGEARSEVGQALPNVTLPDQNGESFRMSDLKGKPAVVYFYPRDDTSGCTREACAFQSQLLALKRSGATVVGISPDSPASHLKFASKHGLKFTLLSDEARAYAVRCGVLVPKTLYGRTSLGIERTTFLVDEAGTIRQIWRRVRVDGHVEQVVAAVKAMRG